MADEQTALDAMVREELGLDPSQLGGSPYSAGASSFLLFSIGAIIPLIPYFITGGTARPRRLHRLRGARAVRDRHTDHVVDGAKRHLLGTRQLCFGLLAAGATFGLGRLIGTAVGG